MQPSSPMATQTGRTPRERMLVFRNMKHGQCHLEAVERSSALHATTKDVGEHISSAHDEDKANNRNAIMKLSSNIRFLARQGITEVVTEKDIVLNSHTICSTFDLKITLLVPNGWSRKPTCTPSTCKTRC